MQKFGMGFTLMGYIKTTITCRLPFLAKEDYPRTRASASKHLPALTHIIFLVNIIGLCFIFALVRFHHGFI
jgi:hypothetical protein